MLTHKLVVVLKVKVVSSLPSADHCSDLRNESQQEVRQLFISHNIPAFQQRPVDQVFLWVGKTWAACEEALCTLAFHLCLVSSLQAQSWVGPLKLLLCVTAPWWKHRFSIRCTWFCLYVCLFPLSLYVYILLCHWIVFCHFRPFIVPWLVMISYLCSHNTFCLLLLRHLFTVGFVLFPHELSSSLRAGAVFCVLSIKQYLGTWSILF